MTAPLGLSAYRWNNNIKSMLVVAAFPCLLLGLIALYYTLVVLPVYLDYGFIPQQHVAHYGYLTAQTPLYLSSYVKQNTSIVAPYIGLIAIAWIATGLLFHETLMRWTTQATPLSRKDAPELYNTLENLCIASGLRMPKLYLIKSGSLNAFASGLSEQSASITVTQALVNHLTRDEMETVLAHELTHIKNHDVRLLLSTFLLESMFSFLPEGFLVVTYRIMFCEDFEGEANSLRLMPFIFMFIARSIMFVLCIGFIGSLFFRIALSQSREFVADAGAITLTKNPEALISALEKIKGRAHLSQLPSGVKAMLFEDPNHWLSFMRSHPSIQERIEAIRKSKYTQVSQKPVLSVEGSP